MIRLPFLSALAAGLAVALPVAALAQDFPDTPKPPPADPARAIQKLGGTRFRLGTMEFDQKTREIFIPAKVNMREGLLEYVLVHESGKLHESLLSTAVKPVELNVVMLLLDWQVSGAFFDYSKPKRGGVLVRGAVNPPASHVEVHVTWKDKDGKDQTCRVENWLHNVEKRAKITVEPFIYTGSQIMPDGTFLAGETGSILALYQDPGSLLNNPREGNELDDIWINDPAVPEKSTPVTVIFKPAAAPATAPDGKAPPEKRTPPRPATPLPRKKSSTR